MNSGAFYRVHAWGIFEVLLLSNFSYISAIFNPIMPGGGFACNKFKFKFVNNLWYEPESVWLFLTFTRDYFAEKKKLKENNKFSRGNIFLQQGHCQKIAVQICGNNFSSGNKYVHVSEVVSTSSFNFVKRLCSTFCWWAIITHRPDYL